MAGQGDILVDFALDAAGTSVLVSYQDWAIERDLEVTRSEHILGEDLQEVRELKALWHEQ